jgi:hypothetical protein
MKLTYYKDSSRLGWTRQRRCLQRVVSHRGYKFRLASNSNPGNFYAIVVNPQGHINYVGHAFKSWRTAEKEGRDFLIQVANEKAEPPANGDLANQKSYEHKRKR